MPLGSALKKKNLILHPVIADRKPYRSGAGTLGQNSYSNRELKNKVQQVLLQDALLVIRPDRFICGSMFPRRLAVIYVARN